MPEWKDLIAAFAALIASFAGAWAAFALENCRRSREERQRQLGSANRALYTLFQYWNTLEQYRKEVIEAYRGRRDAWLNLAANPVSPIALHSFKADDLQFLLQAGKPEVFAEIMLEEQRFNLAVGLIRERSDIVLQRVFPRMAQAGFGVGKPATEAEVEAAIGIDITHKLKMLTEAIVRNVDEDLASLRSAHDSLRKAMSELHPKQKTIEVQFAVQNNAA